jgi:hypothetical protein
MAMSIDSIEQVIGFSLDQQWELPVNLGRRNLLEDSSSDHFIGNDDER